ncbi:MAG: pseudouridine synthase [Lachnospiraceae bacterium]|nr:pseudouridine synthase [Lachnospiraceae bacterium]
MLLYGGNIIRLNKYLSAKGVCSRREADRLIDSGKVTVNGEIATLGCQVEEDDDVRLNGQRITGDVEPVVLAFNKPVGIVCTSEKREKDNIIDYINYPTRIYPVGRLDKDSSGLILLTNRGELVNGILKARNYHEKEYIVTLDRAYSKEFLANMRHGIYLSELGVKTRESIIKTIDDKTFSIILTQGLNRQIRRMCKELGYRVVKLKRIRVMNIKLGNLPKGEYREVKGEELDKLISMLGE